MYSVFVSENWTYMDAEAGTWSIGEFETWEGAVTVAKDVVERSLREVHKPAMEAEELFRYYTTFGEDVYITPTEEGRAFSAWEYARERCREICDAERGEADSGI